MKFCTNCGAQVAEGSKFCTECGFRFPEQSAAPVINEAPVQQPVYEAPVQQAQSVYEAPAQQEQPVHEAPKQEQPKKQKKGSKGKLILIAVVVIALLFGVFGMGGGSEDPNAGIYNCLGYSAMGMTLDGGDDYNELKSNGKATLVLMGEELPCKWTLEGTDFVVDAGGMEFYGTLENGIIALNISDMIFTYERDPETAPAVSEEASKQGGSLFCKHEWVEANCQSPETCSLCGKTKGKTVDHVFSEASHQNPPTCFTCGLSNGEKLPAEMEVYGITEFMEVGQTYDYTTDTYRTSNMNTVAKLTVKSYDIVEYAEGYPAKEGYEWRIVEMEMVFSDWAARNYGFSTNYCREDYYNVKLHDDTEVYDEDANQYTHTVLYNNEEYEVILKTNSKVGNWVNHKCKFNRTFAACVPVGYDGVVIGMLRDSVEYPEDGYIFDIYNTTDFCLFRCD